MFTLITGGAASGKSEYAEQLVMRLGGVRCYIATMIPYDEESRERVIRHRAARADRGFTTFECPARPGELELPPGASVLLDCLGNLAANEMFGSGPAGGNADDDAARNLAAEITGSVAQLAARSRHLTVVTNEIFSDGAHYSPETVAYMRLLASVNRRLAALADCVVEVVCGIPSQLKGAGANEPL